MQRHVMGIAGCVTGLQVLYLVTRGLKDPPWLPQHLIPSPRLLGLAIWPRPSPPVGVTCPLSLSWAHES